MQNGSCALCKEKFTDYGDIVPDHIHPRGMGRAWRDDHPENTQAVHWWCNGERDRAERELRLVRYFLLSNVFLTRCAR
jgi:5-methylcytosine-specific restriction endonuclease McrA